MLAFFGFRVIILQLRRRDFSRDFLRDSAILLTLFFLREIRLVIRQTRMYTDIGVIDLLIGIRGIGPTQMEFVELLITNLFGSMPMKMLRTSAARVIVGLVEALQTYLTQQNVWFAINSC